MQDAIYRDFENAWVENKLHNTFYSRTRLYRARLRMRGDPCYRAERYVEALFAAERTANET